MNAPIRPLSPGRPGLGGDGVLPLAAEPLAAQHARAFLQAELGTQLAEEDLAVITLLASELVTNAVVHAASQLEVFWRWDGDCVTVGVRDADTGPLRGSGDRSSDGADGDLIEGGRGLLIVDKLAHVWGTEHAGGRKVVWFRIPVVTAPAGELTAVRSGWDGPPAVPVRAPARGVASARAGSTSLSRLRSLLLPEAIQRILPYQQHLAEVLARVVDAMGALGGEIRTGDHESLARCGDVDAGRGYAFGLGLAGRSLGTLIVHLPEGTPLDEEDELFLRIAADRLAVLSYEADVQRADSGRARELDYLSEASEMLGSTLSVRAGLTLLTQLVVPRMGEWSAAYLVDERQRLHRVAVNHVREELLDTLPHRLDADPELQAAALEAIREDALARRPAGLSLAGTRSTITVAPLTVHGQAVAVLVVGGPQPLGAMAAVSLEELARRAARSLDNARRHEEQADAAAALQATLLPPALPEVAGLDLAARYHSAAPGLMVGGDFYDAFQLEDDSLVCVVGDACGKGAEAASVTGLSRELIRMVLRAGRPLTESLQRLNQALLEGDAGPRFCTVALARLERVGSLLRARVCLAGHPEPVLLRAGGETEVVGRPGDLLGVISGRLALTETSVLLDPGDALVLYTDGLTERRNDVRMFGQEGVRRTLQRSDCRDAACLARSLEAAARAFADDELRDDLAILVARRPGGPRG